MTSVPFLALDVRWGKKLGDEPLVDAMFRDGYLCPLCNQLMGETSETLATEYKVPREEQDAYALASHQRAERAQREGRFAGMLAQRTFHVVLVRPGRPVPFSFPLTPTTSVVYTGDASSIRL